MSSHETLLRKIPQEKAKSHGTTTKTVNQVIKKKKKRQLKQNALTEGLHSVKTAIVNGVSGDHL